MTDKERLELERALAEPIPRSPAAQKLINDTLEREELLDTRTPEQKQPGPKYVPIGGAGNGA
jgi:hypothetical protein